MIPDEKNAAGTGNDISPQEPQPPAPGQLLGKEAENYLREGGNIEDLPDAEQQEDADKAAAKTQP